MLHREIAPEENHVVYTWKCTSTSQISPLTASDVGKVAWQTSNGIDSFWVLKDTVPTWISLQGGAVGLPIATSGTLGGVKAGTTVSVDPTGVMSVNLANYDFNGTKLSNMVLQKASESRAVLAITGTSPNRTVQIDLANGVSALTLSSNIDVMTLTNQTASATVAQSFTLVTVGNGGNFSVKWPTTFKWPSGQAPSPTNTLGKMDVYTFLSVGDGTWLAFVAGQNT